MALHQTKRKCTMFFTTVNDLEEEVHFVFVKHMTLRKAGSYVEKLCFIISYHTRGSWGPICTGLTWSLMSGIVDGNAWWHHTRASPYTGESFSLHCLEKGGSKINWALRYDIKWSFVGDCIKRLKYLDPY